MEHIEVIVLLLALVVGILGYRVGVKRAEREHNNANWLDTRYY